MFFTLKTFVLCPKNKVLAIYLSPATSELFHKELSNTYYLLAYVEKFHEYCTKQTEVVDLKGRRAYETESIIKPF